MRGIAVFPHPNADTTPLALRANLRHHHVLQDQVVIISGRTTNVPHIPWEQRLTVTPLGAGNDGITHIAAQFGFQDPTDFPEVLRRAAAADRRLANAKIEDATYFLSRITLKRSNRPGMPRWRKALFIAMAHNAASQSDFLHLPADSTVVISAEIPV